MFKKRKNINKKQLYDLIVKSQAEGNLLPEAFELISQLCDNYISQFYYEDEEDKKDCYQTAMIDCLGAWKKFNPKISNNAFSFFTQTIKIGLIKGWNEINPKKLSTISINSSGFSDGSGLYTI